MGTQPSNHLHADGLEEGEIVAPDISTLDVIHQGEINQQIATAKRFPRSVSRFRKEATELVILDEATAAECIYALPRDGKTIEGPSARFAEIVNYAWGNTRAGARTVSEGEEFITAQGLFYDLEKNTAISYEVQRRIVDKNGKRFKVDMIGTTGNAASSIALRNAILKGIPKAIWRPIYLKARQLVAGDIQTLANRRDEALKAFAIYGIVPAQIYATLGVGGVADISIDHMVVLRGILTAIQEGDTTPEQAFAPPTSRTAVHSETMGDSTQQKAETLDAKYRNPNPPQPQQEHQPEPAAAQNQSTGRRPQRGNRHDTQEGGVQVPFENS